MSRSQKQWEFLQDVALLINYAKSKGFKLTGGELKRPLAMQLLYYYGKAIDLVRGVLYLIAGKKRTKTLNSDHLKSLAIDFNIFFDVDNDGDKDLTYDAEVSRCLGDYWKSLHPDNYWGGDWGWDAPHFGRK